MRVAGIYVGLGEGDVSPEVVKIKALLKRKFTPARNTLDDGDLFTAALTAEVKRVQAVYAAERKPGAPKYIPGVINVEFKYDVGLLKRPDAPRPIIFTVEGHMSRYDVGPCAWIASTLEQQGVCWWQPIGYNTTKLPFDNASGRNELARLIGATTLDNGRPFPAGTPWGLLGFSQGAIITNSVFLDRIRPDHGSLHWRLKDLTRAIAFGDPYREKDVDSGWWPDPPKRGTQGISDVRMIDTPPWWKSANRTGDLYTENPDDEAGLYRTSIYKIAAEGSWSGGQAGMLARLLDLATPMDDVLPVIKAILGGILFLGNMNPHGGYNLDAPLEYMRGVAARP
ncbi:hypothetical protein AB0K45_09500 [Micrococcus luteus]|uniref:hypothetical protein n=1 Tax=Micrococcus luteus TaxID=1270 RepID=UPI003425BF0B